MSEQNPKPVDLEDGCQTCQFPTLDLTEYVATSRSRNSETGKFENRSWWLCQVCLSTYIVSTQEYPRQHESGTYHILQAINYGTNLILASVKEGQNV